MIPRVSFSWQEPMWTRRQFHFDLCFWCGNNGGWVLVRHGYWIPTVLGRELTRNSCQACTWNHRCPAKVKQRWDVLCDVSSLCGCLGCDKSICLVFLATCPRALAGTTAGKKKHVSRRGFKNRYTKRCSMTIHPYYQSFLKRPVCV